MPIDSSQIVSAFLQHHVRLLAYVNVIVHNEHLAEDVIQNVAVAAVAKARELRDREHLNRWLYRAARLEALRVLRDNRQDALLIDESVLELLEADWTAERDLGTSDHRAALAECMALVDGYPRQVLEMRYRDGLTSAQIADRLRKRADAIYRVLTRVRTTLRACVEARAARRPEADDA